MKTEILTVLRNQENYVSGQELCSRLGVSRTAVWKSIKQLKEAGYEIEAVPNRGYRLIAAPDILTDSELESNRKTNWLGKKFICYEETDSTNTQAKRLAEANAEHGTVVVSEVQTQGRGRRGRDWSSPKGAGIWFSLILKPDIVPGKASMLTLVAAMAVVNGLKRETGLSARIKWPNDVILSGKKVCGILTEMSAQIDYVNHIVVGIGINVKKQSFPEELEKKATSLEMETDAVISRAGLLEAVLEEFELYYEKYMQTMDVSLFLEEYQECLINKGREVKVLDPRGVYQGISHGINAKGELLVEREGKLVAVNSGEVSVRGIYGYV